MKVGNRKVFSAGVSLKTKILGFATSETNQKTFETSDVVAPFYSLNFLETYETAVISDIKPLMTGMKMLDIGVGGGRTTANFASLVKEYVGIDYSEMMVNLCKRRFPERNFKVMDARNLHFDDDSFEFILFSMNGIDYVNKEDRIKILSEIRRVLKKDGYFCFSTHNLNNAPKICSFGFRHNLLILLQEPRRMLLMRWFNRAIYKDLRERKYEQLIFKDGAEQFRLETYFITPNQQVRQLKDLGFRNIQVLDKLGRKVSNLSGLMDYWLAFICIK